MASERARPPGRRTRWRRVLRALLVVVVVLAVAGAGGALWVSSQLDARLSARHDAHEVSLVVPTPLTSAERDALEAERIADGLPAPTAEELTAVAQARAVKRAQHLLEARYGCLECHGRDLGGGKMVDDPALGAWYGPNLTSGRGSVTEGYTLRDWERIVRHGIRRDGTAAVMPAQDSAGMSDQELADIVTYILAAPPVDREVPKRSFGPVGAALVASGEFPLSADTLPTDAAHHAAAPPSADDPVAFGRHLAQTCIGCHGADFRGGPIVGGDPGWPPATDITGSGGGPLASYSYEDLARSLREGRRPDGSSVQSPMNLLQPFAQKMTEAELRALYAFLKSK